MEQAIETIRDGKCLIYPTETLYAIGASAFNAQAVEEIVRIKARPKTKPLPIIIGSMEQLAMVTGWFSKAFARLAEAFWPGPLSVLVPTGRKLPSLVRDPHGFTSVRLTAHPLARELCLRADTPLIATSANRSGRPGAGRPEDLDPELVAQVDHVLRGKPWPAGGLASTVVRCVGTRELQVLRDGAISKEQLEEAGFTLVAKPGERKNP
ncbi:Sua5/YciO/YrdC/YwlC family protein [Desulfovibrio sp. X2]|uniref:L-threonylcarbamoyladenylate synthase n=1 Tax=Desulfovibrio sp. X2 TaxID=941449 RepID=UPI000358A937|nr:L-threonylcarbamoyladenylate synthase [Desulfovibrio sp. X2]EPR42414.1 Sua5/YciO/YrdC/YwlC family protein [Desulfovibrio sp. X2]